MSGVSRISYTPEVRIIRLMCTGRIDLAFLLRAFIKGADGVIIGGCWPGECHYVTEGNYDALGNMYLCRKLLEYIGINPERLRLEWISAAEGLRFGDVMNDFSEKLKELGPLGKGEGLDENEMKARLETVSKLVPYLKQVQREHMRIPVKSEEAYSEFYNSDEANKLFKKLIADKLDASPNDALLDDLLHQALSSSELVSYYITPDKCQGCTICFKKCPAEAIIGEKKHIHVIDQEKCTKCGTCFEVCPARFGAVEKFYDKPVPEAIPEEERIIIRKPRGTEPASEE